ncbi:hypothetical protein QBC40DRAFT_182495, partial [Triangularia verruculosa]
FDLNKQELLLSKGLRNICPRSIMSVSWIWSSYSFLTGCSYAVICWDRLNEWLPLFGSIANVTSLRRFWGVFWHRLHVSLFDRCMSHAAVTVHRLWPSSTSGQSFNNQPTAHAILAAPPCSSENGPRTWMFYMSAACHTGSN